MGRDENKVSALKQAFGEICQTPVDDDGLKFLIESITGESIREGDEYKGVRLSFEARVGVAKIPIQVDIGFGDAVLPQAELLDYPTMLDFPSPHIYAYPCETVVAEKFQAMVVLGIANSRMKDFFDIWFLARQFGFDGSRLSRSIRSTFERRKTLLPRTVPLCLSPGFYEDRNKQIQWRAFLNKSKLNGRSSELANVVQFLHSYLWPPTTALTKGETFEQHWPAGGPWEAS